MIPLGLLATGEVGEIAKVTDTPDALCATRAEDMGLRVGTRIEMLANRSGAVLVKVDGSRMALGLALAMRIKVRTAAPPSSRNVELGLAPAATLGGRWCGSEAAGAADAPTWRRAQG